MTRHVLTVCLLMAFAITLAPATAAEQQGRTATLTGKWVLTVPESPHGPIDLAITFTQTGTDVTATLTAPGDGDHIMLAGSFVKGELTMSTPADQQHAIRLKATLKDDGTLAGFTSSDMGDLKFVGARAKN